MGKKSEGYEDRETSKVKDRLFISGDPKLNNFLLEKSEDINLDYFRTVLEDDDPNNVYKNPLLIEVQKKVISEIDASVVSKITDNNELYNHIEEIVKYICEKEYPTITNKEKTMIIKSLLNEINGFGPLQKLLHDDKISEIMVNGPNQTYIEKNGILTLSDVKFRDADHVIQIIDKIVSPLGRRIDEGSPMVDARLPDGSRINAIIPPISISGPTLTIRKFSSIPFTIDKLISTKSLSGEMAKFLEMAVLSKANIIVAGGTGSGKTTLLNILSSFIPKGDRIVTIEDSAELRLQQPHIISLESRPPNIEGKGEITIRDLVRNSLRMRPDRIVIGEVRGAESLDMLQAMNTGHEGSLSTVHANSARDALSRLETMVLYSGIDFPIKAIREQIYSAIDLIIYIQRLNDGSRKVTKIAEITGMESDLIALQEIFYFEQYAKSNGHVSGQFKRTSIRPKITDKFQELGFKYQRW